MTITALKVLFARLTEERPIFGDKSPAIVREAASEILLPARLRVVIFRPPSNSFLKTRSIPFIPGSLISFLERSILSRVLLLNKPMATFVRNKSFIWHPARINERRCLFVAREAMNAVMSFESYFSTDWVLKLLSDRSSVVSLSFYVATKSFCIDFRFSWQADRLRLTSRDRTNLSLFIVSSLGL